MFKRVFSIPLLLLLTLGCGAPKVEFRKALHWVDAQNEAPEMDVSGMWESSNHYMAGGWGSGAWVQTGARVIGNLGPYTLEGKVSGKKLYLLILSGGKVYYTAILETTKEGGLAGSAVCSVLPDDPEARFAQQHPVLLIRPAKSRQAE